MSKQKIFLILFLMLFAFDAFSYLASNIVTDLNDYRGVVGVVHPWDCFDLNGCSGRVYGESVSALSSEANEYALAVASFVKSKCRAPECRHVLLVGDDFVVPSVREFSWSSLDQKPLLSDKAFIPGTLKSLGDVNGFFNKNDGVVIVLPNVVSAELRRGIDDFKRVLNLKYGFPLDLLFEEINGSVVSCESGLLHPLTGKTVVVIGSHFSNPAISCFGASAILGGHETFGVFNNPWGDFGPIRKQVLIINSDSPQIISLVSYLLEHEMIRSGNYDLLEFLDDGINACDLAGWVPAIGEVGDGCALLLGCASNAAQWAGFGGQAPANDNAGFWCSYNGAIILAAPWVSGKGYKFAAKYGGDLLFKSAQIKVGLGYLENLFEHFVGRFGVNGERVALQLSKGIGKGVIDSDDSRLQKLTGEWLEKHPVDLIESGGDNQLVRVFNGKNNTVTKNLFGSIIDKIDDFTVLVNKGWNHIVKKHVLGVTIEPESTITSFWPVSQSIEIAGNSITLAGKITQEQIKDLVQEGIEKGTKSVAGNGNLVYTWRNVGKHDISEIIVVIDPYTGIIKSAYPTKGVAVTVWDNVNHKFCSSLEVINNACQ